MLQFKPDEVLRRHLRVAEVGGLEPRVQGGQIGRKNQRNECDGYEILEKAEPPLIVDDGSFSPVRNFSQVWPVGPPMAPAAQPVVGNRLLTAKYVRRISACSDVLLRTDQRLDSRAKTRTR